MVKVIGKSPRSSHILIPISAVLSTFYSTVTYLYIYSITQVSQGLGNQTHRQIFLSQKKIQLHPGTIVYC